MPRTQAGNHKHCLLTSSADLRKLPVSRLAFRLFPKTLCASWLPSQDRNREMLLEMQDATRPALAQKPFGSVATVAQVSSAF